jgi:hypothetical protein
MSRNTIPGRLDLEAMAPRLYAPRTSAELQAACREMAGRGMSDHTIARATGLSVEAIRRVLGDATT